MATEADLPVLGYAPTDTLRDHARAAAIAWKRSSATFPEEARAPGLYDLHGKVIGPLDICLPQDFAEYNLLPDVRNVAVALFDTVEIVWHDGVGAGPSNHLLDSQVQCVNAVGPGVTDPEFVKEAFGYVLPIAEVVPIEEGRFLTFEYTGAEDYLGERKGLDRTRGSMTTSADAAIRYFTPEGEVEIALIEWKFTEDYRGHELVPPRGAPRDERYRALWDDPGCPIRHDLIPYKDLFVEPFYQLFRQQLLAWRMEQAGELSARRVRVVHACPRANNGVHGALNRPSHQAAGSDALEIWHHMCLQPDRFVTMDTVGLVEVRDGEYADRYRIQS